MALTPIPSFSLSPSPKFLRRKASKVTLVWGLDGLATTTPPTGDYKYKYKWRISFFDPYGTNPSTELHGIDVPGGFDFNPFASPLPDNLTIDVSTYANTFFDGKNTTSAVSFSTMLAISVTLYVCPYTTSTPPTTPVYTEYTTTKVNYQMIADGAIVYTDSGTNSPVAVYNTVYINSYISGYLSLNLSSYFILQFKESPTSVPFVELEIPASSPSVDISDIVTAYCEKISLGPLYVSSFTNVIPTLYIKCVLHHIYEGDTTETLFESQNFEQPLLLAKIARRMHYTSYGYNKYIFDYINGSYPKFSEGTRFYSLWLTYRDKKQRISKTEPKKMTFLADYSNLEQSFFDSLLPLQLKIDYFYDDDTASTYLVPLDNINKGNLVHLEVDYPNIKVFSNQAKNIKRYDVRIVGTPGNVFASALTFVVDQQVREFQRTFCFLNSIGGWEYFSATGTRKIKKNAKGENVSFFTPVFGYFAPKGQTFKINVEETETVTINTGNQYDRRNILAFQEILQSPSVYLVEINQFRQYIYTPIRIVSDKLNSLEDMEDLQDFSFDYQLNFDDQGPVDFLNN